MPDTAPQPQILFVDDDPSLLASLKRRLRQLCPDWACRFADGPEDAITAMAARSADVVVSDMDMPGMTGLEMIKRLQHDHRNTRYVVLTGTADLQTAICTINEANVFRFYTKPARADMLITGIGEALADLAAEQSSAAQTEAATSSDSLGTAALNEIAVGVVVCEAGGHVRFVNRVAGDILALGDGLAVDGRDVLRADTPAQTKALHEAIAASCAIANDTQSETALAIERPSGLRALAVVVLPIGAGAIDDAGAERLAAVFISDPEERPTPPPATLSALLGLTPAEARLVHALASGVSLDEAAETCGIRIGTARSYLKQVFQKTGTSRQAELVKLVMTSPALRPATDRKAP